MLRFLLTPMIFDMFWSFFFVMPIQVSSSSSDLGMSNYVKCQNRKSGDLSPKPPLLYGCCENFRTFLLVAISRT